jgi:DNA repair exonuclease SbcCD ATPase subunit
MNVTQATNNTPEQTEALAVHNNITAAKNMIGSGLHSLCLNLKECRDKKTYAVMGYDTFGDYTAKEHNIEQRQAYGYIRVIEQYGAEFLQLTAKSEIGVTKLLEIAVLDKESREQFFEENPPEKLQQTSAKDVKKLVAEIQALKTQVAELEARPEIPDVVQQQPFEEVKEEMRAELAAEYGGELETLRAELAELQENKITDEEIRGIRAEAREDAEKAEKRAAELEGEKRRLETELKKLKDAPKEVAAVENPETQKRLEELTAELEAAKKQLTVANDVVMTKFKIKFEDLQKLGIELGELLNRLDGEKRGKCAAAVKKITEGWDL